MRRLTPEEFSVFTNDRDMLKQQGGSGDEVPDNAWFFADDMNCALAHGGGCIPFVYMGYGEYDMHFLFPNHVRGIRALISAKAMVGWMLTHGPASVIYGTISRDHRAARWFIRRLGFAPVRDHAADEPRITYTMDRATWLGLQQSEALSAA